MKYKINIEKLKAGKMKEKIDEIIDWINKHEELMNKEKELENYKTKLREKVHKRISWGKKKEEMLKIIDEG